MYVLAQAPLTAPPEIDWRAIAPELALLVAGVVTILWVAFLPRARGEVAGLTLVGLAAAGALTAWNWSYETVALEGAFASDGITRSLRVILLIVGVLATLMAMVDSRVERRTPPETFPLMLFALTGMSLIGAAADLLVVFIALELFSLSLYILTGANRRRAAQEAAMKYFLLGAFSSAFLLYGIALIYGATGTTNLREIAGATGGVGADLPLLLAATAMLAVGFLFKIAAVPFHAWTPDVYQGAPVSVTAFMAAATKAAAFAAFLRVFVGGLGGLVSAWQPVIAGVAVVTMLVGAVLALVQTDVKRLLAYSSIAHAGYLLVGLAAATPEAVRASMFYLLAYAVVIMGAFMVVQAASRDGGLEGASIDDLRGLARRRPWLGGLLALFMFSLAGVPPALTGFWAKYVVFQAAVDAGLVWLVVVAVVSSLIAAAAYLRVAVTAFLRPATGSEPEPLRTPALGLALGGATVLAVVIGLVPQLVANVVETAGRILG